MHNIALGCINLHAPGVHPFAECGQVPLQGYLIFPASIAPVEQTVVRKESDLGGDNLGQVIYMQEEEQGAEYCPLGHPQVHRRRAPECPTDLYPLLPGPRLNIKTVLSTYGDFHVKDKTAVRTSYL